MSRDRAPRGSRFGSAASFLVLAALLVAPGCRQIVGIEEVAAIADAAATATTSADATTVTVAISGDEDDAMWAACVGGPPIEELADPRLGVVTVSTQFDQCVAFRFVLDLSPGATVQSAYIRVDVPYYSPSADDTMEVTAWDSVSVPPFSATHRHGTVAEHGGILLPDPVRGWSLGSGEGPSFDSPDVGRLVQSVVARPDWAAGNVVAFLVRAQSMPSGWLAFMDKSNEGDLTAARLRVTYR